MCLLFGRHDISSTTQLTLLAKEWGRKKSCQTNTTFRENSKVLKKLPYARTDDTAELSGHVYISHFWRDSGGTVHHTSVMSCVYFFVGRKIHPQTQLTFLTKEWGWRKSPKPITTPRVNSKVLKKRHYAPADAVMHIFPISEEIQEVQFILPA